MGDAASPPVRVDFYQLLRDPAEAVLPLLARSTLDAGERLLVVSSDPALLDRIDASLWSRLPESFLAHGRAGGEHDARQPILLSDQPLPANAARYCVLADGVWREHAPPFARLFYLFDAATVEAAGESWRMLGRRDGLERHFWKQDPRGRWVEGP